MLPDRDHELRRLEETVAGARAGRGGAVLLGGGIGAGRTTVLRRAGEIAGAAGLRVLRATAAVVEQDFDHGVAGQLFDPLLATAAREDRARWLAGTGGAPPPALGDGLADTGDPDVRHRWIRELQDLLETVAADGPVALLVDDLQWSDAPSLRWLTHLAVRAPGLPVALVASVLDGDPGSGRSPVRQFGTTATGLRARGLGGEAIGAVVSDRFGTAGDPEFLAACREVSGGSPLVLRAVLDEVAATGAGPVAAQATTVRAARPAVLRERFARSVRGQDEPARRYLRAAAVLGPGADPEVFRRLCGLDPPDLRTVPPALAAQGLLAAGGGTTLAHPLVGDVAAEPAQREDTHRRAAWLLHELGHPGHDVARHLLAVAAPLDGWATEVLRTAAHEAAMAGDAGGTVPGGPDDDGVDTAVRYLRRVLLDSDVTGHERAVLLVELASAERFTEPSAAVRHVAQALPLLGPAGNRARALTLIDPAVARDAPASVRAAIRAADGARDTGPGHGNAPGDATGDRDPSVALRIRARVRRMDEQQPEGLAASCALLRDALAAPDELLSTSAGRELLGTLLHAAALSAGTPSGDVADLAERLLRITPARRLRTPRGVPDGDGPRGLLVLALVAADRPVPLDTWLAPPGTAGAGSASADELALAHFAHGRTAQAAARPGTPSHVRDGVTTAFDAALVAAAIEAGVPPPDRDPAGHGPGAGVVAHSTHQMLRGAAAGRRSEWDLALECFLDGGRHLDHVGWRNPALFPWRGWVARLHHRRGDPDAALAAVDEELVLARQWGAAAALGRTLRVRGSLLGGAAGVAELRASVDVLAGSADRRELARSEVALGRRLERSGDPGGAALVQRGRGRAADLGAGTAPSTDPAPVAAGTDRSPPGLPDTGGAALPAGSEPLTEAERRVVDMVVGGATNQVIADELGVSRRAVEKRLTRAYRKLGVAGRSSLPGAG